VTLWSRQSRAETTICGELSMRTKRIEIIPALHGKLTRDRKLSEPDIYCILEKWLEGRAARDDDGLHMEHDHHHSDE
jgi:hypothetical protein